uniref:Kinesin motor domain-containing protein n=1 Tax=Kalanchoe fedtschenkoi TaxID=63787 RepID=A0A7N1A6Y7_KALFE
MQLQRGIFVAGLREEIVVTPEQVLELMEFGESHRHIGETNMNLYSSRSHTIFRMIIESRDRNEVDDQGGTCDAVRVSVLNLVDLAGSERAAKTGAEGVRLKEGSHINKSLMTLGTVIKKLSEGAETQGSHVPYRDSKLTRILQPALGGNANTGIICNITLAQIHADETKSSLQFASRALRVTNCAHVNEILTDAALLKRQKNEIEDLRAKLQGSHSEHFESEILNLRNTLLQTELEKERIALELEEEKRAQAEGEKRLQEQAMKIKNLSTMVLNSRRGENHDQYKKGKRRDTWCPGILDQEKYDEVNFRACLKDSSSSTSRPERFSGPLLPFAELDEIEGSAKPNKPHTLLAPYETDFEAGEFNKPPILMHVTSRRKVPPKYQCSNSDKTSSLKCPKDNEGSNQDYDRLNKDYEDLLGKFVSQKIESEVKIECLTRKLADTMLPEDIRNKVYSIDDLLPTDIHSGKNLTVGESEAILVIKHLQEQITILEKEKSSEQERLDSVIDLATQQTISASKKYEELYEELLEARENAREAHGQLNAKSIEEAGDERDRWIKLDTEVKEIMHEFEASKVLLEDMFSMSDEFSQSSFAILKMVPDLKSLVSENNTELKSNIENTEKLHALSRHTISTLEFGNNILRSQYEDCQKELVEVKLNTANAEGLIDQLMEQLNSQEAAFQSKVQLLEQQITCLSSCSLAKEKDSLRKDLDKTKSKLKETECKLRNIIQEKTRLEGEKACAERESKRLQGQKNLLERDINKRDSIASRRRDSVADWNSNVYDSKRGEYQKLEVLAFEMEATIASLEDQLSIAVEEKENIQSRNETLALDLDTMSEKLKKCNYEVVTLQEEISCLKSRLEESGSSLQSMQIQKDMLEREKEEFAMQLANALLESEEEKAVWSAKEKALVEAIEENSRSYAAAIKSLSDEMSEMADKLKFSEQECHTLRQRLTYSESTMTQKSICSRENTSEINRTKEDPCSADIHHLTPEESNELLKELSILQKENEGLLERVRDLEAASNSANLQDQVVAFSNEKELLKMKMAEQQSSFEKNMEDLKEANRNNLVEAERCAQELTARISSLELKVQKYRDAAEESNELQKELSVLQREKEGLLVRVRELEAASNSENLQDQLITISNENELLKMTMTKQQSSYETDMEVLKETNRNKLVEADRRVEELTSRISSLELKLQKDRVTNMNEMAKLRMRLHWTQDKVEAVCRKFEDAIDESRLMDTKYKEAADKLKKRIASSTLKNMNLEKQLASVTLTRSQQGS